MTSIRLLPLLAIAAVCLFGLKAAGLFLSGGYMITGSAPASAQADRESDKPSAPAEPVTAANPQQPEQGPSEDTSETAQAPDAAQQNTPVTQAEEAQDKEQADPAADKVRSSGKVAGAELAVLQSLAERRKELDRQAREMQLRENLLKAAEQRVEVRIKELKAIEQRIETELKKKDDRRDAEYAKLVTLYSKMKPKRAARIFNRLDIEVLTDLVRRMSPRTISPIFAAMDPAVAERVTLEIANQSEQSAVVPESLPKISSENPG